MAITAKWFGAGFNALVKEADVDWETDTVRCALMAGTFAPNQDTQDYWSDISAEEIAAGNGYTAEGVALTGKSATYNAAGNIVKLDAADAVWANSSIQAAYAVIYVDTGNPATSVLLGYVDFGGMYGSQNSDFTIVWDDDGILRVTIA